MKLSQYRKLQQEAHRQVKKAIIDGRLPKIIASTVCKDCGKMAQEYDHRDYEKPLEVEPVCHFCNMKRGAALPPVTDYDHIPKVAIDRNMENFKTCNRCGHEWFSRAKNGPQQCAHCRSKYWNKPRVRPIKPKRA